MPGTETMTVTFEEFNPTHDSLVYEGVCHLLRWSQKSHKTSHFVAPGQLAKVPKISSHM